MTSPLAFLAARTLVNPHTESIVAALSPTAPAHTLSDWSVDIDYDGTTFTPVWSSEESDLGSSAGVAPNDAPPTAMRMNAFLSPAARTLCIHAIDRLGVTHEIVLTVPAP